MFKISKKIIIIAVAVFAGSIDAVAVQCFAADEAKILPRHVVGNAFAGVLPRALFHQWSRTPDGDLFSIP